MFENSRVIRFIGLVVCSLSINACATPSQAYWDAKVKELCEKDGGVTVYEKVMLSHEEYKSMSDGNGNLRIPFESEDNASTYFRKLDTKIINKGNPKVGKGIQHIIRRSDNKILGTRVTYIRSGGDVIVVDHPSNYNCNGLSVTFPNLADSIFDIQGENK